MSDKPKGGGFPGRVADDAEDPQNTSFGIGGRKGNLKPSQTLFGLPSSKKKKGGGASSGADDDASASGRTMFGVGTRSPRSGGGGGDAPLGVRRPSGKVRQTLMGLGSVRLLNEPEGKADDNDSSKSSGKRSSSPRSTMAGMPAVSLDRKDKDKKGTGGISLPADGAARNTMFGMPAVSKNKKPAAEPAVEVPRRGGGALLSQGSYNIKGASEDPPPPEQEEFEDPAPTVSIGADELRKLGELQKKLESVPDVEEDDPFADLDEDEDSTLVVSVDDLRSMAKKQGLKAAEEEEEEFDPLAGMAGVGSITQASKVSSLIDEEVEDLTASVFGDDFAFSDDDWDFEDDDDDLDAFDFASHKQDTSGTPAEDEDDDVHHDVVAAEAALMDMMADLDDFMPTEDEAAAALGLDESLAGDPNAEDPEAAHKAEIEAARKADEDAARKAKEEAAAQKAKKAEEAAAKKAEEEAAAQKAKKAEEAAAKKAEEEAAAQKAEAKAQEVQTLAAPSAGPKPFALGLGLGVLGALCALLWPLLPIGGDAVVAGLAALKMDGQVLVIFSCLAAALSLLAILLKLPMKTQGLVMAILGLGLGVLGALVGGKFDPPLASASLGMIYGGAALLLAAGAALTMKAKESGQA